MEITTIDIYEGPGGFYVEINEKELKDKDGSIRWFSRRCDASRVARRMMHGPFRVVHWYAF
jgi:predicted transcriptional regulator